MNENIRMFVVYMPADYREAFSSTLPLCHMGYQMASGRHLVRKGVGQNIRRGLLSFPDDPWFEGKHDEFITELVRECGNRAYEGAVADFEGEVTRDKAALLTAASEALEKRKLKLYVPESYGMAVPKANVLISSAISGGTLSQRLSEATMRYGEDRIALEVQKLAMDFTLPSPSGLGTPLSDSQLDEIMSECEADPFFSNELCAHYFTYRSEKGHHFVIYDSAASIKRKLSIAASAGIKTAFLLWSEISDWIGDLV